MRRICRVWMPLIVAIRRQRATPRCYGESPPAIEITSAVNSARFDLTSRGCYDRTAGWSSLVARWAHNPKVGGSNPPPATKSKLYAISCLNRVERAANQSQLAPISSHSSRCRYVAFSAARPAPGEFESIISTTLLFAVCCCAEMAWV